jgi:hypothetical protein
MKKLANKRVSKPAAKRAKASTPSKPATVDAAKQLSSTSKQSRLIAMLQSPAGATIAAMMKDTDWQQHSVRGFLAGVVRKKLKLKLGSKKVDGQRIYRIGRGAKVDHSASKSPAT